MNLRVELSSTSDIFDSVMSARLFYIAISTICTCSDSFNLRLEESLIFQQGVDFCFEIHLIELTVN